LKEKIENSTATQSERDEYVEILHKSKNLDDLLYNSYRNNKFVDNVINTSIIIGGIIILGMRLNDLLNKESK
jgi:hypothetical protein